MRLARKLLLTASPWRALIEGLVVGGLLLLYLLQPRYEGAVQERGLEAVVSLATMICALPRSACMPGTASGDRIPSP